MLLSAKKTKDSVISYFNSTNILMTEYFFLTQELHVIFTSGRVYQFNNVSVEDYALFQQDKSTGSYFHKKIKSKYASTRLDDINNLDEVLKYTDQLIEEKKNLIR